MLEQQILGDRSQFPLALSRDYSYVYSAGAGFLGNPNTQVVKNEQELVRPIRNTESAERPIAFNFSSARLEKLKRQKFTIEGKQERISKALAALYQEIAIELSPEAWRFIAEDPDLEDQF
ncbi:MAG: hypothetical protein J2P31_04585 [Blastocatellia bacterium]|nr:hypothetical protein [Blastocatellia bacterium]